MILRLESKYGAWNPESCWHEMNRYIKEMILDTLQREEREILHLAQYLPWVDEEMCEEILGTAHAEVILGRMLRKGFLVHTEGEQDTRWSVAPIFCHIEEASLGRSRWMKIGKWYETHDHRAEQLQYDSLMPEVQLNLSFMRPQILTEQWVEELKPGAGRLLILQETKISCLCDIRDLSGLFACEKRRERQFARRWKECLDEDAWIFYRLARIEYYLETDRLSSVADEDMQLLIKAEELPSAFRLSALWLLIRIQRFAYDEERKERIERLETKLIHTENHARSGYAKAVASLNITAQGSQENLAKWLKSAAVPANAEVTEENIVWFYWISSVKSVREVQTPSGKNASISECTPELTNPRRGSVRKGGRRVESGAAWAGTQKCHRILPGQRKEPICHVLHRIRRDRPQSAGSLH